MANRTGISGRSRGRPCKLTPQLTAQIATLLANHQTIEVACAFVGINPATYHIWMAKGETARSGQYLDFFNTINQATAQSQVGLVKKIEDAATRDWKAAAWLLSRRYQRAWGGALDPETPNQPNPGGVAPQIHVHLAPPTKDPFHPADEENKDEGEIDEQWSARWHEQNKN